MKRAGANGKRSERSDRGASPTVGIVLLFGMVFVGAMAILVSGSVLLDGLQEQAADERAEQNLRAVDETLATQALSGEDSSLVLEPGEAGQYNVSDLGNLSVTVSNRFGASCEVGNMTLGTLEYENQNGDTIAYQAGGIWRQSGGQTTVVSEPDIQYYTDGDVQRLDISVSNLSGTVGQGEHTARPQTEFDPSGGADCLEDIGFVTHVTIEVEDTPYHDGWANFLDDEFDVSGAQSSVDHDPDSRSVTVEATLDYQSRPFSDYVAVDPTIYGGLYADNDELTLNGTVTVDRYNGTVGWDETENVTEDLLVANGDLDLESGATVSGIPVANEELTGEEGANVSSIAFATDPDGEWMNETNGTDVYNVTNTTPPEVVGAEMSESFDGIDSIDDDVTQAIDNIEQAVDDDEFENASDIPSNGTLDVQPGDDEHLYYGSGHVDGDDIDDIDTSNGNVSVAVDGDLVLEGIDNIDGDGQAYFYVSGKITVDDVTIEDERASNLWIYGTSGADIDVKNEFQGVVYAPGSDLTIQNDADVYGALVGGKTTVGDDATIHFDRTLRTDIPIPEENRDVAFEYTGSRDPYDVTFVLDKSGSMSNNDEDGLRADATKDFIGLMDGSQGDQAGVYEFDDDGNELHHLSGDLSSVNESVEANVDGGTDMSVGMEPALDQYEVNGNENADRVMILLSDGANDVRRCTDWDWLPPRCNEYYTTDDANESTIAQAERASDLNVTIYTVGLGDDLDEEMLQDIADETDGEYYHVDDASELNDIFVENIGEGRFETTTTEFEVSNFHDPGDSPDRHVIDVREWPIEIDD